MKEFGYLEKPSRGVIEREHFILSIGKLDLFKVSLNRTFENQEHQKHIQIFNLKQNNSV